MNSLELTVKKQYDDLAPVYDQRWSRYICDTLLFFREWLNISPSATVLDVACGTGELERLLLEQYPSLYIAGVDISEQMLVQARQKLTGYTNVSFENTTASSLPFSDESFDVVISANSFHYFSDPEKVLTEMRRVLKPGGTIAILDWCKDFWLCRVCDWVLKILDPAHQQCYTEAELHAFLKTSGFHVCRSQRVRLGLIWGLMAVSCRVSDPNN
ncbi:MAG: methyltransferase domain-containing protein [Cyanobacteriota bacterium]|nr:methyltransferase domain-containing protein [Cyanobacteriota bacterium]